MKIEHKSSTFSVAHTVTKNPKNYVNIIFLFPTKRIGIPRYIHLDFRGVSKGVYARAKMGCNVGGGLTLFVVVFFIRLYQQKYFMNSPPPHHPKITGYSTVRYIIKLYYSILRIFTKYYHNNIAVYWSSDHGLR